MLGTSPSPRPYTLTLDDTSKKLIAAFCNSQNPAEKKALSDELYYRTRHQAAVFGLLRRSSRSRT